MIDALNACQVRDRAELTPNELVERLVAVAPKAVRARRRTPALMRKAVHFKQDPPFGTERWSYGFLVDTIFTRDTWMHRTDICRATVRRHDDHPAARWPDRRRCGCGMGASP